MSETVSLLGDAHCNKEKVELVEFHFGYQSSNVAIKSHTMGLVISNACTTISVVVEGNDVAIKNAFFVWSNKLFISVVTLTGRHERQIPIGKCSHIVLIAFFQLEKIDQSELCPFMVVHSLPPFSKRYPRPCVSILNSNVK